jgi:hypothetical protein
MQSTPPGEPSPWGDGELYDILCQGLDDGIDFHVGLARAAQGPVLDIARGTGRVLLPVVSRSGGRAVARQDCFCGELDVLPPPHVKVWVK